MQIITRAKLFTSIAVVLVGSFALAEEWKVDWSRRFPEQTKKEELREPASVDEPTPEGKPGFFDSIFTTTDPAQEIVVLNTDKGFIPSQVRVRQGQTYKVYVVNVN